MSACAVLFAVKMVLKLPIQFSTSVAQNQKNSKPNFYDILTTLFQTLFVCFSPYLVCEGVCAQYHVYCLGGCTGTKPKTTNHSTTCKGQT